MNERKIFNDMQVKSLLTYKMTLRRLLVLLALHLCYIAKVGHSFNIDTDFPIHLGGPNNGNLNKHFGHSLQLYEKVSGLVTCRICTCSTSRLAKPKFLSEIHLMLTETMKKLVRYLSVGK